MGFLIKCCLAFGLPTILPESPPAQVAVAPLSCICDGNAGEVAG
jgi:hypothetical protein